MHEYILYKQGIQLPYVLQHSFNFKDEASAHKHPTLVPLHLLAPCAIAPIFAPGLNAR